MMPRWLFSLIFLFFSTVPALSHAGMQLIDKLSRGVVGDYIVTAIDNTYTVLIIKDKQGSKMSIEEITVPLGRIQQSRESWKGWRNWVEDGAPGNTSWLLYPIDAGSGKMPYGYSYTKQTWLQLADANNFLSKLLTLELSRIAKKDTKRVGPPPPQGSNDSRRHWTPQMVFEGQVIQNVRFEAWRTHWPQDSTELSGKLITIYVPQEDERYPSYFPYWLEIQGMIGKAKVRIIDSGRRLFSPAGMPPHNINYEQRIDKDPTSAIRGPSEGELWQSQAVVQISPTPFPQKKSLNPNNLL